MIDGIEEQPGRIIIMTSNKKDFLDKALIRPRRIDIDIEFTLAKVNEIIEIIDFYYDFEIGDEIKEKLLEHYTEEKSHAKIVEICRSSENLLEAIKLICS